jgi:hypothetical protein
MTRTRAPFSQRPCTICRDTSEAAEVALRQESRTGPATWTDDGPESHLPLCSADYAWLVPLVRSATGAASANAAQLGVPARERIVSVSAATCNMCQAALGDTSFLFELLPGRQLLTGTIATPVPVDFRQHRICRPCASWLRTTLADPSAVRRSGTRHDEGPPGGWLSSSSSNAVSVGLSARDETTVQTTIAASDRRFLRLRSNELPRLVGNDPPVIFVGASPAGRAAQVTEALPDTLQQRLAIVARSDSTRDTAAALRGGAREFLAWPLSPQQIAGAIDRIQAAPHPETQDQQTGLPVLTQARALYGKHGFLVRVEPGPGDEPMMAALLLRRFLRGYDIVGSDGKGALAVMVFCEVDDLSSIARRLRLVLGEGAQFTTIDATVSMNGVA